MKNFMVKKIHDEYEASQLNPIYSKNKEEESFEQIEDLTDKLPEQAALKLRIASLEAVADQIIEDAIEEQGEELDTTALSEELETLFAKGADLHLVPRMARRRINELIANHLRRIDPRITLMEKAAHFSTAALVRMEEEDTVVEKVLDTDPADTGFDITEEVVERNDPEIEVDAATPAPVEATLRYHAASTVNHRKSTAIVTRKIAASFMNDTLYRLRNHLPERFKKKYCC